MKNLDADKRRLIMINYEKYRQDKQELQDKI